MNTDLRSSAPPRRSEAGILKGKTWAFLAIVSAALQSSAPLAGDAANTSLAARVADGRPWTMHTNDGRKASLTLFADGTGAMTGGPMPLSPKWRPTRDGVCLKPATLTPERCVVLVPTNRGFAGSKDGAVVFTLER